MNDGIWEAARFAGDGYDRAEVVERVGWRPIASWGVKGWDLGDWPYVMFYFREGAVQTTDEHGNAVPAFELAVNVEGDVDQFAFPSKEAREHKVDELAGFYWREGSGPTAEDRERGLHLGPCRPDLWETL